MDETKAGAGGHFVVCERDLVEDCGAPDGDMSRCATDDCPLREQGFCGAKGGSALHRKRRDCVDWRPAAPAPSQPTPEARVDLEALEGAERDLLRAHSDGLGKFALETRDRAEAAEKDRDYFKERYASNLNDERRALEMAQAAIAELRARRSAPTPGYREAWEAASALLRWFVENQEQAFDDSYDARRNAWPVGDNRAAVLREWDRKLAEAAALLGSKP